MPEEEELPVFKKKAAPEGDDLPVFKKKSTETTPSPSLSPTVVPPTAAPSVFAGGESGLATTALEPSGIDYLHGTNTFKTNAQPPVSQAPTPIAKGPTGGTSITEDEFNNDIHDTYTPVVDANQKFTPTAPPPQLTPEQQQQMLSAAGTQGQVPVDQINEQPNLLEDNGAVATAVARATAPLLRSPSGAWDILSQVTNAVLNRPIQALGIPVGDLPSSEQLSNQTGITSPLTEAANDIETAAQRFDEKQRAVYDKTLTDYFFGDKPDYEKGFSKLGGDILQALPTSLAIGATTMINPAVSAGAWGSGFAAQKKKELDENPNLKDMPENEKVMWSTLSGASEIISEQMFGAVKFVPGMKKQFTKLGEEGFKDFWEKYFKNTYGRIFARYFGISAEDGITEGANKFVNNAIDIASGNKPNAKMMDGVADEVILGIAMGHGMGVIPTINDIAVTKKARKEAKKIMDDRYNLNLDLERDGVPDAAKKVMQDKVHDLNEREVEIAREEKELLKDHSDAKLAEIAKLSDKAAELEKAIAEGDLSDESKEILEKELDNVGKQVDEAIAEKEPEPTVNPEAPVEPSKFEGKSDADLEKRMTEIDGSKSRSDMDEFNALEKEMEVRERDSVFGVPLKDVNAAVDALIKKDKQMPNGYGAFIDPKDARETKRVADKYSDPKELTDSEVKKDFTDALMGNPDTWYADGLQLRESANEAASRGISLDELFKPIVDEYVKDGYTAQDAKETIQRKLKPILKDAKTQPTNSEASAESTPASIEAAPENNQDEIDYLNSIKESGIKLSPEEQARLDEISPKTEEAPKAEEAPAEKPKTAAQVAREERQAKQEERKKVVTSLTNNIDAYNSLTPKEKKGELGAGLYKKIQDGLTSIGYQIERLKGNGRLRLVSDKGKKVNKSPNMRSPEQIKADSENKELRKKAINATPESVEHAVIMDIAAGRQFSLDELWKTMGVLKKHAATLLFNDKRKGQNTGISLEFYGRELQAAGFETNEDEATIKKKAAETLERFYADKDFRHNAMLEAIEIYQKQQDQEYNQGYDAETLAELDKQQEAEKEMIAAAEKHVNERELSDEEVKEELAKEEARKAFEKEHAESEAKKEDTTPKPKEDATKTGELKQSSEPKHQDGNESGKTAKTSDSDSTVKSGESKEKEALEDEEEDSPKKGDPEVLKKVEDDLNYMKKAPALENINKKFEGMLERAFIAWKDKKISYPEYTEIKNRAKEVLEGRHESIDKVDYVEAKARSTAFINNVKEKLLGKGYKKITMSSMIPITPQTIDDLLSLVNNIIHRGIDAGMAFNEAKTVALKAIKNHPLYKKLTTSGELDEAKFYEAVSEDKFSKALEEAEKKAKKKAAAAKKKKKKKVATDKDAASIESGKKGQRKSSKRILENEKYNALSETIDDPDFNAYNKISQKKANDFIHDTIKKYEDAGLIEELAQNILDDNSPFPEVIKEKAMIMLADRVRLIAESEGNETTKNMLNKLGGKLSSKYSKALTPTAQKMGLLSDINKTLPLSVEGAKEFAREGVSNAQTESMSNKQKTEFKEGMTDINEIMQTEEAKAAISKAAEEEIIRISNDLKGKEWTSDAVRSIDSLEINLEDC